jgi:hypothetical protein
MAIKTGEDSEPLADPEDKKSFFDRIKSDVSRITAGNIDDPKSEAYKKYGAGRDAATTTGNKSQIVARIPPAPRMLSPNEESGKMQNLISAGSDFSSRNQDEGYRPNAGTASERAMLEGAFDSGKITENTGPRTKPVAKKPRIVSKKELEDSGFDNLRDYLNDQKGLSRKSSDKHAEARKNLSSGKKRIDEGGKPYRSGGSVSSASSRADGIAQRGKTRGKMC